MGRKKKVVARKKMAPKPQPAPERNVLEEYGLEKDDELRFRHQPEQNWTKGRLLGQNRDYSLSIVDDYGKLRAFVPEKCQKRVRGPRGGQQWVDVTKNEN